MRHSQFIWDRMHLFRKLLWGMMEVMGRDDDVQSCAWMTPRLSCPRNNSSTWNLYILHEIPTTHFFTKILILFCSSFSLGPGIMVPAMRLRESKVSVARSHLSDTAPKSVPVTHISEMCVSLKATILWASMDDSICLTLYLKEVVWHWWKRR